MLLKQILFLTLISLPLFWLVYKIRKHNIVDLSIFILIITSYIFIHYKFVFGYEYAYHDTAWTYHVIYSIVNQWIENSFSIGWNPFMNGGEPLYLYSNYFLWAEFFFLSLLNKFTFHLPTDSLINLFFSYIFISYFTFSFILFSVLFRKRYIVFFPFVILVFSGITYSNIVEPTILILYLLPLIIISLYFFLVKQNLNYLFSVIFFICLSANHYLPHYIVLFVAVFISMWMISIFILKMIKKTNSKHLSKIISLKKIDKKYASLMLITSLLVLLPVAYVYMELKDYTSPTRGGKLGAIKDFKKIENIQRGVFHPLNKYKYLLEIPELNVNLPHNHGENLTYHHSVYYIGSISLMFFFLAFMMLKKKTINTFFLTTITTLLFFVYFSLENNLLWNFLNTHVDIFFLRHSFQFANIITFFIIIVSGFGFMSFKTNKRIRYAIIIFISILSIYPVMKYSQFKDRPLFHLKKFQYPQHRSFYSKQLSPIPFDFTPLILKEAAATHPIDDFTFFQKDDYYVLLKTNPQATTGNLFSFIPFSPKKIALEGISVPVHYLQDQNPNHLKIMTEIPEDGFLIRKENFHKGWTAKVNNINTPIIKYGNVFQAIKVKKGLMLIDFKFDSLYTTLMYLHIIFVFIGYFAFFRYFIRGIRG